MTTDALDPGPDGTYPYLPRNADGTLDTDRMPVGSRRNLSPDGQVRIVDLEPTLPDGRRPSDVAPLPPAGTE